MHPDIDYAFVRVGNEVLVMAEKLVEEVSKACELKDLNDPRSQKRRMTDSKPFAVNDPWTTGYRLFCLANS